MKRKNKGKVSIKEKVKDLEMQLNVLFVSLDSLKLYMEQLSAIVPQLIKSIESVNANFIIHTHEMGIPVGKANTRINM